MLRSESLKWLFPLGWIHLASPAQIYTLKNDLNDEDFDLKVIEFYIIRLWWNLGKYFITCWSVNSSLSWEEIRALSAGRVHTNAPTSCLPPLYFSVSTPLCPSAKVKTIQSFHVLSSNAFAAIFTSCFEISCVSCPLTKQKLADLMCITQLKKKKKRLGNVSDTQSRLKYREWIWQHDSYLVKL